MAKSYWFRQVCAAALVGGVAFVVSGHYGQILDYQARHLSVELDPSADLQDASQRLTDEDWRQIDCLARNEYFEARGEGRRGMEAVSAVVFNRVASGLFPDSVCQVVTQCNPVTGTCQFSWVHDGRDHTIRDRAAWNLAMNIAVNEWLYREKLPDMTGGATRYHAFYVSPNWKSWRQTVKIGAHLFYRPEAKS